MRACKHHRYTEEEALGRNNIHKLQDQQRQDDCQVIEGMLGELLVERLFSSYRLLRFARNDTFGNARNDTFSTVS
jgi:hypothetical protein